VVSRIAYYDVETITAVKFFIVQALGSHLAAELGSSSLPPRMELNFPAKLVLFVVAKTID